MLDDLFELKDLLANTKRDLQRPDLSLAVARDKVEEMIQAQLDQMEEKGDIEQCPACGGYSAYAWSDVSTILQPDDDTYNRPGKHHHHLIAHIGSSSCFEWECGHCGAHCVEKDGPLDQEVYTHTECE